MKSEFSIFPITKEACDFLLYDHHYLSRKGGFKVGNNYGLFKDARLVGVCIFTTFPVSELVQSAFGLDRSEQAGFFELSRLVLHPDVQAEEHNITSWFVSRSIKQLRTDKHVRAILSYADADHHKGTIYAACNFTYHGFAEAKNDYWLEQPDGTYVKHIRGKMKGLAGEWRPRSRKHRFLMIFDKTLRCLWPTRKWRARK